jgi:hypothetical protein
VARAADARHPTTSRRWGGEVAERQRRGTVEEVEVVAVVEVEAVVVGAERRRGARCPQRAGSRWGEGGSRDALDAAPGRFGGAGGGGEGA